MKRLQNGSARGLGAFSLVLTIYDLKWKFPVQTVANGVWEAKIFWEKVTKPFFKSKFTKKILLAYSLMILQSLFSLNWLEKLCYFSKKLCIILINKQRFFHLRKSWPPEAYFNDWILFGLITKLQKGNFCREGNECHNLISLYQSFWPRALNAKAVLQID